VKAEIPGHQSRECVHVLFAKEQPDARVHTWNLTLEKEVTANIVARTRYVGNHTAHLEQYYEYNGSTPDYIWYMTTREPTPTGLYSGVARRAFDQKVWGTIREYRKTGGRFNGMEFEPERRYSKASAVSYVLGTPWRRASRGHWYRSGTNQFMPGTVLTNYYDLNRFLNYQRDTEVPKPSGGTGLADLPFRQRQADRRQRGRVEQADRRLADRRHGQPEHHLLPTSDWNFTGEPIHLYGRSTRSRLPQRRLGFLIRGGTGTFRPTRSIARTRPESRTGIWAFPQTTNRR
jgi:hypothetical protein